MPSVGALEFVLILVIIAIFVAPILLLVAVARRGGGSGGNVAAAPPARDPALDALRSRLAAGEIDEAEYQRLRAVLQRT
jgi:uncharacterized membrane protein